MIPSFLALSCGNFLGFASPDSPDTGDLPVMTLYLAEEELQVLYDSVVMDRTALCRFSLGGETRKGEIRIRGLSSRMTPKKSFTLRPAGGKGEKYALDAGGDPWISYGLAMYSYALAGLPAPQFTPVALYVNRQYLGYYNLVRLYDDSLDEYYRTEGELFKVQLNDFAQDFPLEGQSEKKFPDNRDFGALNHLLTNTAQMSSEEWIPWVEEHMDLESVAAYMVVRDYFGVADTSRLNFYLYFGPKGRILPWDNDRGFSFAPIGGNNLLTRRMLESGEFRRLYKQKFNALFLQPGEENILSPLRQYLEEQEQILDRAAAVEPAYFLEYTAFLEEVRSIHRFLTDRGVHILGSAAWAGLETAPSAAGRPFQ